MKFAFRLSGVLVLLFAVGCGGDRRATVSGKVAVAGKGGLPGGTIQFIDVENPNRIGSGQINADGTYEVTDAPVGDCKVVISNSHLDPNANKSSAALPTVGGPGGRPGGMSGMKGMPPGAGSPGGKGPPKDIKDKMGGAPKGADVPGEMNQEKGDIANRKYLKIDPTYSTPDGTTLKATVKSGSNSDVNFEVK